MRWEGSPDQSGPSDLGVEVAAVVVAVVVAVAVEEDAGSGAGAGAGVVGSFGAAADEIVGGGYSFAALAIGPGRSGVTVTLGSP